LQPPKFFVRDATGLVREFGALDVLLIASAMVFALVFTTTQFAWFYGWTGGANLPLSLLVAAIPFVFLMIAYWGIGLAMPRTGSDYVWVSRVFGAPVGFAWALLYMLIVFLVAYVGEIASFSFAFSITLTTSGLPTFANSAGLTNLGNYLGGTSGTFFLATIFTIIFGLFAAFGSRFVKGVIYVSWVAAIVGMVLMWYILGTTSNATFVHNWNAVVPQAAGVSNATYSNLANAGLAAQTAAGVSTGLGGISMSAIVVALPLASLFLFGGNYVNAFAGEIKGVKRAIPIALFLSLIFGIIYWSITSTLTLNTVGASWITQVGYNWNTKGTPGYGLPFPPSQPLILAVAAYGNNALIYLMFITYILGSIAPLFAYFWIPSKYFFAWSFDRAIPARFSNISQRFHTPYLSIIAIVVLGIGLSAIYNFLGWSTTFTIGSVIWGIAYIVPGLAVMVFPFVKKDLFARAPGFVKAKLGSVPLISIVGAITAIGFGYIGYIAYGVPAIGWSTTAATLTSEVIIIIVVVGLAVYFAMKSYYSRKGVDIGLAFKEIPPE
jgi:amino acid transporter